MAKSKQFSDYLRVLATEIIVLVSSNQGQDCLVPELVVNNAVGFLFDLRETVLKQADAELSVLAQ